MLLAAVDIDDNEVTYNQSRIIFNIQQNKVKTLDERVNEWMLFNFKYCYNMTFIERRCVLK